MADFTKLRKALNKKEIMTEMNNPTEWISTGSAVLNYRLTGTFDKGIPNRRSMLYWGESGTGKTFLTSNACKDAQAKGYKIIYIDSEDSISEDYMEKIGIDLSDDMFLPINVSTIEEATSAIAEIFSILSPEDKFMLVIDSLAGLLSEKEDDEFTRGVSKGDMGQFAKKLKLFTKNINKRINRYDAFCILVTHAYQNQDMLNGEGKWICTGGKGFQYFPSMSVMLEKAKLKDGEGRPGVRIKFTANKTRFTAPMQKGELHVPYEEGIDFTDGMLDVLVEEGTIEKNGGWYNYENADGDIVKFQQNKFAEHFEAIMAKYEKEGLEESDDHFGGDLTD